MQEDRSPPNSLDATAGFEDNRLIEAVKEFMGLLDSASAPPLDDFLRRYPDIAEELKSSLEGLALVHKAAGQLQPTNVANSPEHEFTAKPIGDFQIVREIGRGGMGVVYEAIQLSLGRRVALKVLPFASGLDAVRLQRFRNEAHAAAQLHHTNIVPVHAVGSDRGVQYYAMQLIDGHTLAELIDNVRHTNSRPPSQSKPVSVSEAKSNQAINSSASNRLGKTVPNVNTTLLSSPANRSRYYESVVKMVHQATLALEHAHQYGVVHRDIKPANLLLDSAGKVWVTDFGLAQIQQAELQLTRSGDHVGTLRYMSPEQASGDRSVLDHRTDIYSLGVTLYELLTLEPAIRGQDYRDMLNQVAEREPLAPRQIEPSIPIDLDTIVRKAIAKEPNQRYPSAQAFGDDLQRWLDNKPIAAKPPTVWERMAKWRKRNKTLVNVAAFLLVLASAGLLLTTLLVLQEQQATRGALARERQQREAAEMNFQQARTAVDTFSDLSETELAFRPEFQSLRRRILETSLEFYRKFVQQRADEGQESTDLLADSARVSRIVDELKLLDSLSSLLLLADPNVQRDLGIDPEKGEKLTQVVQTFQNERDNLGAEGDLTYVGASAEIALLMREFVDAMAQQLDDKHHKRLKQIVRQQNMPFTFLSLEVSEALALSHDQRQQISRIIQEERIDRRGPPPNDKMGPPPGGFGPGPWRPGPPPPDANGERGNPPRTFGDFLLRPFGPREPRKGPERDSRFQAAMVKTNARITEILTPAQRLIWQDLIGEPFVFRLHHNPQGPPMQR